MKISIANDFSPITGLRHCDKSEKSGEEFYHSILNEKFYEAYTKGEKLELDLDGTIDSYSPSFLDEAVGNLVYDFTLNIVKSTLSIISKRNESWKNMIETETYPQWEKKRKGNLPRKITDNHVAWYRYIDGEVRKNNWD